MNKLLQIALVSSIFATAGFAAGETAGTLTINGTMNVRADYTGTNPVVIGENGRMNIGESRTFTAGYGVEVQANGQIAGDGTLKLSEGKKISYPLNESTLSKVTWDPEQHLFNKWFSDLPIKTIQDSQPTKSYSLNKVGEQRDVQRDEVHFQLTTRNEVKGVLTTFFEDVSDGFITSLVADTPKLQMTDLNTDKTIVLNEYNLGTWNRIDMQEDTGIAGLNTINATISGGETIPLRFSDGTGKTLTIHGDISNLGYLATNAQVIVTNETNLPKTGLLARKLTVESGGDSPLATPDSLSIVLNATAGNEYGLELKKDITVNGHLTFTELHHSYEGTPPNANDLNDEEKNLWTSDDNS